jgi:hypothetical protein
LLATSVTGLAFWYVICQSASHSSVGTRCGQHAAPPIGTRQIRVASKKWPRKTGAKSGRNNWGSTPVAPRGFAALARAAGPQSPGYGRSPLRIARPAWAINRRSMVVIMRPNSEAEGMRSKEAVLDILSPNGGTAGRCSSYSANLGMPDARCNSFVCIAAYYILQRSIKALAAPKPNRQAAGSRRPLTSPQNAIVYSAAILRGGSSAPESWISAT